jgi:hypothetical protein
MTGSNAPEALPPQKASRKGGFLFLPETVEGRASPPVPGPQARAFDFAVR